jgi:hypothetical protein
MFATAPFAARSYGMVVTEPVPGGVSVRVIVFVRRGRGPLGRALLDPLHLEMRRFFIRRFLSSDAARLDGARYNPHGLIDADRDLAEYFQWLAVVSHGTPWRPANGAAAPEGALLPLTRGPT